MATPDHDGEAEQALVLALERVALQLERVLAVRDTGAAAVLGAVARTLVSARPPDLSDLRWCRLWHRTRRLLALTDPCPLDGAAVVSGFVSVELRGALDQLAMGVAT